VEQYPIIIEEIGPHVFSRCMPMEKIVRFDGIPFRVKYEHGILYCAPLCPVCESEVVRQAAANGTAMYICTTQGKGCENPVNSFGCTEEMAELEKAAAIEIDKYLQREAEADVTYRLPQERAGS
jgi:hypothetical protein